ncbi:MAG: tetratricopeptide repeat protein [Saprospiraceae bacterium]|nr:tetratricopeptide repeat protein [Saprospiraceae bacterium]
MKVALCCAFGLLPFMLLAQTADSVAIRQVDSLLQVSNVLTGKKDFVQALDVAAAAEKIALEKLGQESATYGSCCDNHGKILFSKRDYAGAEKWYLEAKAIREKNLGKEHPDYAFTLYNLGWLYRVMGQYDKAEPLFLEAKAIREKVLGREHPDYASTLNGLAVLYQEMAQPDKAEPLYLEAKAIREKVLGKEHPDYATSLSNLGALYRRTGRYDKAEPLYLEAKAIREKVLGKEHPDYAISLANLAILYSVMDQYEKAEPLYLETIAIRAKTLGKEHPDYAQNLYNLAMMYSLTGQYEKAEPYYLECKNIWGKVLGVEHPDYAASLSKLVTLYQNMGQYDKAEPFLLELSTVNKRVIERALHHLSESELNDFLDRFSDNSLSQNQTLTFTQISGSKKLIPVCYDNSLFYKGFLLQSVGRIKKLALSNPVAAEKYARLQGYQRQLATQYARPISKRDSALVAQLESSANDLEKDLAQTVAGFGQALQQVKWQEVQAALKPNEAAIEFVSYRFYLLRQVDSTFYVALILLPGKDAPQSIPLFEEKQLTALLQSEAKPQPAFYNDLYAAGKTGSQLYDLIWKPIAAALPERTTVYCSPSGLLHRLHLAAIPTPDGNTLADNYRLTLLGSTRQLAVPPVPATNNNNTAQLYGGIQYDATPLVAVNSDIPPDDLAARRGPDIAENDSTLRGETWNYLRWTDVEVSAAAEIMKGNGITATVKKGAEATEESFKALGEKSPSPRILHVATHGFFFPDPGPLLASPNGGGNKAGESKTFKVSNNPMIRSGLVLAGGNYAWKTGKPARPDLEDGILTAYEISQMNLSNTELVVLSACETGLGDIHGNEGVYGLQRAFKIAGAKYLIMSLWQVPDFQTQVFMSAFYRHWLNGKMPVPEAFRATQSELRAKYGEAFKWAGFVLVE